MTARLSRGNWLPAFFTQLQKRPQKIVAPLVALAVFLLLWQLLSMMGKATLPGPFQVWEDTQELIFHPFLNEGGDKGLGWQTLASLQRVAVGYSLAAVVGIALGILVGASRLMYDGLDPLFQVLRTVPPLAWLPIALAVFRNSEPAGLFVIFITAIWPIIFNTAVGVQQIPQDYRNVAKVLRLSGQEYFLDILLPSIVPYMFTGLRLGIGLAWLAIVAAEMLRGDTGIGFFIWNAYNSSNNSEVILALIYIGVVGFLLDKLVGFVASFVAAEDK
ncbi:bicarbonate ABC transporter permease [Neosynechococcus sphagnicola sy1]|uniref:Bicarbonate ABC transporter permease n=1 Tax=Neosynechococcus sphagnicola sy1 TaxID=1497020 RepID=A0A098TSE3_9CYAN|nr:nitrate ABC transporter permease [Neosynechococcus sphagnicola]KGF73688.1 bicarbonate ABC transporter permease [Neosynechococcus sphagnicola sy1]